MAASDPVPSINPAYELAPIEAGEWKGLMVQWTTEDGSLTAFLATDDGANLLAGYKRASNILRAEEKKGPLPTGMVQTGLPNQPEAETTLAFAVGAARTAVEAALARAKLPREAVSARKLMSRQITAADAPRAHAGGLVACHIGVDSLRASGAGIEVLMQDGTVLLARSVVNAAGLHACQIARNTQGLDPVHVPRARYAKGSYFTLSGRSPFARLIYPAPDPEAHLAGLGVHLTLDLGGQAKFGPDVQWTDDPDDLGVNPASAEGFYAAVRQYWPGLPEHALLPGYAGMRPKISGPHEPAADFRIDGPAVHGVPGLVNLLGIESPGLTSCLAIGEQVAALL